MDREQILLRRRQRRITEKFIYIYLMNLFTILIIMLVTIINEVSGNNQIEDKNEYTTYESEELIDHNAVILSANASDTIIEIKENVFCRNISENDKYMLAKLAMAEAEGESLETKILIILTVLNRVESKEFPNTIEDVIFQSRNGVYQFSPVIHGGRWWEVEPNEECWEAVEIVNTMEEDISKKALYFEACFGESWHSRNLEFICKSDNTRFYK